MLASLQARRARHPTRSWNKDCTGASRPELERRRSREASCGTTTTRNECSAGRSSSPGRSSSWAAWPGACGQCSREWLRRSEFETASRHPRVPQGRRRLLVGHRGRFRGDSLQLGPGLAVAATGRGARPALESMEGVMDLLSLWRPYLAGVLHGDGWLGTSGLGLRVADKEFSESFVEALRVGFGFRGSTRLDERGYWLVRIPRRPERFTSLLTFEPSTNPERAAWLRGYFDSEGNVEIHRSTISAHAIHRRVAMFSTCVPTLIRAGEMAAHIGIDTRIRPHHCGPGHKGSKTVYALHVKGHRDIAMFAQTVGSSITRKQSKLDQIVAHYQDLYARRCAGQAKGAATRRARRNAGGPY